jgi:hypothetical protein
MMGRPSEDARSHSVAKRGGKTLRQINAKTAPAWGRRGRQTSSRGPMDSNEMRLLRRLVDRIDATGAANVADSAVLGWMEEDLRARLAIPVEPTVSESRQR